MIFLIRNRDAPVLELRSDGILAPGVHAATFDEVVELFGRTARRRALALKLGRLVHVARRCGIVREIYVDGSFVTDKADPGDIDIILGIEDLPEQPNSLDVRERTSRVRRLHKCGRELHVFAFPHADWKFEDMLGWFCSRRTEEGGGEKGIVRLVGWENA
ncbi:MAG: hypothetical protein WAN87_04095 [Thermoplasmata archaeon]